MREMTTPVMSVSQQYHRPGERERKIITTEFDKYKSLQSVLGGTLQSWHTPNLGHFSPLNTMTQGHLGAGT